MGLHFHHWTDYNGAAFSPLDWLYWGYIFTTWKTIMGLHFRHWTRKCIFLTALHGYLVKSCYMIVYISWWSFRQVVQCTLKTFGFILQREKLPGVWIKTQSYVFWMTNWVLPTSMNILAQWKINKQIKWNYFYPYHVFDDLMLSGPCCCCEILYRRSLLHDRWLLRLAYHIELVRPRLWKLPWVEVNHVCRMCDWLTPFVPKLNNGISFQSGC